MKLTKVLILGIGALSMCLASVLADVGVVSDHKQIVKAEAFDVWKMPVVTAEVVPAVASVEETEYKAVKAESEKVLFTVQSEVRPVFRELAWFMGLTSEDTSTDKTLLNTTDRTADLYPVYS